MAEQREDPVADPTCHPPTVGIDDVPAVPVVQLEHLPVLAGLVAHRHRGGADQVAEEDRQPAELGRGVVAQPRSRRLAVVGILAEDVARESASLGGIAAWLASSASPTRRWIAPSLPSLTSTVVSGSW